jgi:hypothetical protein
VTVSAMRWCGRPRAALRVNGMMAPVFAAVVIAAIAVGPGAEVRALPMFASSTGHACSACHDAAHHLNAYGIEFLRHGDRPAAMHGMLANLPLGLSVGADGRMRLGHGAAPATRAPIPPEPRDPAGANLHTELVALADAHLALHAAADLDASSRTPTTQSAFLEWVAHAGRGGATARFGIFPCEAPFLSPRRRLTVEPYASPVALDGRGLALGWSGGAWSASTGLIESRRQPAGTTLTDRFFEHMQDSYLSIGHDAGSTHLYSRFLFDRQDSSLPTLTWMQHLQAMGAGEFSLGRVLVTPGYIFDRFDDRPAAGIHDRHQYYLLEATVPMNSGRWWLNARAEQEYRTRTVLTAEEDHLLTVVDVGREVGGSGSIALEWHETSFHFRDSVQRGVDLALRLEY